jgi:hypothetical protein
MIEFSQDVFLQGQIKIRIGIIIMDKKERENTVILSFLSLPDTFEAIVRR